MYQKTVEATGDLARNKVAEKITKTTSNSTCEDPRKYTTRQIPQATRISKGIYLPAGKHSNLNYN